LDIDETGLARRVSQIILLIVYANLELDVPTWQEFVTKASKHFGLHLHRSHFLDP
jgi:Xaa-Pro aminopeptidase